MKILGLLSVFVLLFVNTNAFAFGCKSCRLRSAERRNLESEQFLAKVEKSNKLAGPGKCWLSAHVETDPAKYPAKSPNSIRKYYDTFLVVSNGVQSCEANIGTSYLWKPSVDTIYLQENFSNNMPTAGVHGHQSSYRCFW